MIAWLCLDEEEMEMVQVIHSLIIWKEISYVSLF